MRPGRTAAIVHIGAITIHPLNDGPLKTLLTTQNIEELGQFIKTGATQKLTDPGNPWVLFQLEITLIFVSKFGISRQNPCKHRISIGAHRAELDAAETLISPTHPALNVENRSRGTELDQSRQQEQDR